MKVLLTGGSGNLGQALVPRLLGRGDTPVILDVRPPRHLIEGALFIEGSILDRAKLTETYCGCDCIVHIAAWHVIYEDRGEKNAYDFFDLNVRGTFEVFEAAAPPASTKLSSYPQPVFTGRILSTGAARFSRSELPRTIASTGI